MVVRVKDGGESKCRAVMARIRVATPTRKRADFLLVFRHERTWPIGLTGSADDGASWCSPGPKPGSGKFLAARRVTENDGRGTPGVDKELWGTPQRKLAGALSLAARGYHPQPLRRIYIPKAKRQTETAGDSDNAGQSHAGLISAGSRSNSGDHGGPRILRFPASAQLC